MFVRVDLDASSVTLEESDDCTRFHVEVVGEGDDAALGRALAAAGAGRFDGGDAFVDVEAVRRLAAGRVGPTWDADFAAMVDYARTKGWLDSEGGAIQAHVERSG
jgi:hypothetical protein